MPGDVSFREERNSKARQAVDLPEIIVIPNRCVFSRLDTMCIVLRRLCDLESLFAPVSLVAWTCLLL